MSEESMENFQGIHASVITALRCSKTRVWNSAGPQIFSQTPELHTRNSAGLRTLDWNAIKWQNSRPGIPSDSRTLIPESAGLQNSEPGIHRNPEFRVSVTRNSGGLRPESKADLEFRRNSGPIFTRVTRIAVEFRIVVRHAGNVKYTYKMQLIYRITLTLRIRRYSSLQAEVSSPSFVSAGG